MLAGLIALAVIGALGVTLLVQYQAVRGKARPLAEKFSDPGPDGGKQPPPLGTEAIDHAYFNRAMRRNNALSAYNGAGDNKPGLAMEAHLMPPLPPRVDETDVTRKEREAMSKGQKR